MLVMLKGCPFCGSKVKAHFSHITFTASFQCLSCGALVYFDNDKCEHLIDFFNSWNRRECNNLDEFPFNIRDDVAPP